MTWQFLHSHFFFVRKCFRKNKSVQSCHEEPLLYEFGNGSHFFYLRNQDGSNYPFSDEAKNHVCLVSLAQLKKPKVSAKTVVVPFLGAHNRNHRDKTILSWTHRDKTVLSSGQIFVPRTSQNIHKCHLPGQSETN